MNSAMDPEKDIAQVYRCLEIMSMYEERYEMPGRFRCAPHIGWFSNPELSDATQRCAAGNYFGE